MVSHPQVSEAMLMDPYASAFCTRECNVSGVEHYAFRAVGVRANQGGESFDMEEVLW